MVTEPCDPINVASLGSWAAERDNKWFLSLSVLIAPWDAEGLLSATIKISIKPCYFQTTSCLRGT